MIDMIKNNKIAVVAVAVVIAGLAWYGSGLGSGATDGAVLTSDNPTGAQAAQERAVLDALLQLRTIELRGDVFSDPAFLSLRDFRSEIVPEPVGRRNPFAPLGASDTTSTVTPVGAQ